MSSLARIEELEKKYAESPRRFFAPLANEFRKGGDPSRAIELCRAHLEQQPNHMSGQVVLGQALFDAGLKIEARSAFEMALSLDPENLIALKHLGDMARETGELGAARDWYQKVLDVDSRNHEVIAVLREIDELINAHSFDSTASHEGAAQESHAQSISDRWAEAAAASEAAAANAAATAVNNEADAFVAESIEAAEPVVAELPPLEPMPEMPAPEMEALETEVQEIETEVLALETEVQDMAEPVDTQPSQPAEQEEEFWSVPEELPDEVRDALSTAPLEAEKDLGTDRAMPPTQWLDLPGPVAAEPEPVKASEPEEEPWAPSLADTMTYNIGADVSGSAEEFSADDVMPPLEVESSQEVTLSSPAEQKEYVAPSWLAASFTEELESGHQEAAAEPTEGPQAVLDATVDAEEATAEAVADSDEGRDRTAANDPVLEAQEFDDALAWEAEAYAAAETPADESEDDVEFASTNESDWLPGLNRDTAEPEEEAGFARTPEEPEVVDWQVPEPEVAAQLDAGAADLDLIDAPADDYMGEEPTSPAPAVFITETMAQLYEQQGYLEMAAAVYRQLLDRAPESERLKKHVDDLEKRVASRGETPRDRRTPASDGDSARDFFSSLVQVPLRPRLARPYVSGRVDAIQMPPSGNIADAGAPAREDPSALSLENVFKNGSGPAGVAATTGFSFDNFFTNEKRGSKNTSQSEPRARKRRGEDAEEIEQFNSWLEGLKRS